MWCFFQTPNLKACHAEKQGCSLEYRHTSLSTPQVSLLNASRTMRHCCSEIALGTAVLGTRPIQVFPKMAAVLLLLMMMLLFYFCLLLFVAQYCSAKLAFVKDDQRGKRWEHMLFVKIPIRGLPWWLKQVLVPFAHNPATLPSNRDLLRCQRQSCLFEAGPWIFRMFNSL